MLVEKVVRRLRRATCTGRRFAVWGLAFKPRTDDMREAPSIVVIEELLKRGAARRRRTIPRRSPRRSKRLRRPRRATTASTTTRSRGADALLIVTEWNEFRRPDFARMKRAACSQPVIFDGRNLYEPDVMREHGFTYFPIGRAAGARAA